MVYIYLTKKAYICSVFVYVHVCMCNRMYSTGTVYLPTSSLPHRLRDFVRN